MGWGACLRRARVRVLWFLSLALENLYISRVGKDAIEARAEECEDLLQWHRDRLLVIAGATIADRGEGFGDLVDARAREVNDALDEIEETAQLLALLRVAKDNRDEVEDC